MVSEEVRRHARNHPEAFQRVAEMSDGQLGKRLKEVLQEESGQQQRVPADD